MGNRYKENLEREEPKEGTPTLLFQFDFIYSFTEAYYILDVSQRKGSHFGAKFFHLLVSQVSRSTNLSVKN